MSPVAEKTQTPIEALETADRTYTLLTNKQRYCIVLMIGIATMFSPLTANIYLPCIALLQHDYNVSLQLINTTVTAYVLVQSVAPAFFSQLADKLGRRPVYLITFAIFVCASIGLALQGDYAALLVLRMLQSAGSSVSTSIGFAVVADMAAPSERGKLLGLVLVLVNLGPVIAPVMGGPICDAAGWRWLFWLLAIAGFVFLAAVAVFLPETNRRIVGNGIIRAKGINRPLLRVLVPVAETYEEPAEKVYPTRWAKIRAHTPNPLRSAALLTQKDSACVLGVAGLFYAAYYIMQASLPPLFAGAYGYDETEIGLCYLAISLGVIVGSQVQSRVLDWNYRVTAKSIGWEIDRVRGDDLSRFPIERARARLAWLFIMAQCACILAYGWALHFRVHPAMPLVFMFAEGCFGWVQSWNMLLVDIHRDSPATASAASSLVRGLMAAGGVAAMEPLYNRIGIGPFFSLLVGVLFVPGQLLIYTIRTKGMGWRVERERREKMETAGEGDDE
jgi:multidrug resistance protein